MPAATQKKTAIKRKAPARGNAQERKASQAAKASKEGAARRTGRANWGANELPRQCRKPGCTCTNSSIINTIRMDRPTDHPKRIVRRRKCLAEGCGQIYVTIENLEAPSDKYAQRLDD